MNAYLQPVTNSVQLMELAALARVIWHEHYDDLIGAEQVDYMLEQYQSVPALTRQLSEGYEYYTVTEMEGQEMIGFCGIHPQPEEHRLFLSKLYIAAPWRGQGLASKMMEFLEAYGRRMKAEVIWLTVNRGNTDSIAVYEHLGFQTVRQEVTDIGHGYVMDDYIMEKNLKSNGGNV